MSSLGDGNAGAAGSRLSDAMLAMSGQRSESSKPGAPMESYAPGLTKLPTDLNPAPGPRALDVMGLAQPGQPTSWGDFSPGPEGVSAAHAASVAALRRPAQYQDTLGTLEGLDAYQRMKEEMAARMEARRQTGIAFQDKQRAEDMAVLGLNDPPDAGEGARDWREPEDENDPYSYGGWR